MFRAALRERRGVPVVVNYWATWCEPCKAEMPRIVDAALRYEDRVAFLGVDVEDDAAGAVRFARRYGIPFPSLGDPNGAIRRDQRIPGLPVTQFWDAAGNLAFVHNGEIEEQRLRERIDEVLRVGRTARPTD